MRLYCSYSKRSFSRGWVDMTYGSVIRGSVRILLYMAYEVN